MAALDANSSSTDCTASSLQGQTSRDVIEHQRHCFSPCEAPLIHAAPRCCDQPNAVADGSAHSGLRCRSYLAWSAADRLCQHEMHTGLAQHLSRRALPSGSACREVKVLSVLPAIQVISVLSAFAQVGSGDTVRRRPAVRAQRAARRLRPAVTEWEQPQLSLSGVAKEWPSQPFV
jgi:hypothetical protein